MPRCELPQSEHIVLVNDADEQIVGGKEACGCDDPGGKYCLNTILRYQALVRYACQLCEGQEKHDALATDGVDYGLSRVNGILVFRGMKKWRQLGQAFKTAGETAGELHAQWGKKKIHSQITNTYASGTRRTLMTDLSHPTNVPRAPGSTARRARTCTPLLGC